MKQTQESGQHITDRAKAYLIANWAWFVFLGLLIFQWRQTNLWKEVSAYGDVLENVWGIIWYHDALLQWKSPFNYPLIFHPQGWSLGTWALSPLTFALAQPFMLLTKSPALSYNAPIILSMVVAYVGAKRFFRFWSPTYTADLAALAWTFAATRQIRGPVGHIHTLWMTALFGWLGYYIIRMKQEDADAGIFSRNVILAGIVFGLTVNFSLYSIFICPLFLLLLGDRLRIKRIWIQAIVILAIGFLMGLPSILPIVLLPAGAANSPTLTDLTFWSTNFDSLFLPNRLNAIPQIGEFVYKIYSAPYNESASLSFGFIGTLLAIVGLVRPNKAPRNRRMLILLGLGGLLFTLGPFLKLGGEPVVVSGLEAINQPILALGQSLKPEVFTELSVAEAEGQIPLPYSLIMTLVPRLESARSIARFAYVSIFAVFALACIGLNRLPRGLAILLSVLWIIESLPFVTEGVPIDLSVRHPAYEWLIDQQLPPDEGILDMTGEPLHGGMVLYSSYQTGVPSAAFVGSFLTATGQDLADYTRKHRFSEPFAEILRQYNVRYLFIHMPWDTIRERWDEGTITSVFPAVDCFDPPEEMTPFNYRICVAEVPQLESPTNVLLEYGLSREPWGLWSVEPRPRAQVIGFKQVPHLLVGEAFPHCVEGRNQAMEIFFNDEPLQTLQWENCEPQQFSLPIDGDIVNLGINEIKFDLAYAVSQTELGTGSDPRTLGVGFSRLELVEVQK